ncbi:MAG: hypothetical protein JSW10_02410 [Pseudomonadota bacterium]|nr:MAG: hypothetical protein JSW10_02410 [Pseudomonadota bacterium]
MRELQKLMHGFSRALWYSLVALLVVGAVLISLARVVMPELRVYRDQIEQVATAALGHDVRIASFDARLAGLTPKFVFKDVRLVEPGTGRELIRFAEAQVGIALIASLQQRRFVPDSLTVLGMHLAITRRADGTLWMQSIELADPESQAPQVDEGSSELARWMLKQSTLRLEESGILWKDMRNEGKELFFSDVSLRLLHRGDRHLVDGKLKLPEGTGRTLRIALDVAGDLLDPTRWEGKAHLFSDEVKLGSWGYIPKLLGVSAERGNTRIRLWGEWRSGMLARVSGEVRVTDAQLSRPGTTAQLKVDRLSGVFAWQGGPGAWSLDVDRLRFATSGREWPTKRMRVARRTADAESELELGLDRFRLQDLAALLLDSKLLEPQHAKRLARLEASGDVAQLHFRGPPQPSVDNTYFSARVSDLRVRPDGTFPGVRGLDATLVNLHGAGSVELVGKDVVLNIPWLFRNTLDIAVLAGRLDWRHRDGEWGVSTDRLAASNAHVSTESALLLTFPGDGAAPYLDLQSRFRNGNAAHKSLYLPVGIMPGEVVEWVDQGVVSGTAPEGGVVFSGRVNGFPFDKPDGRFLVDFRTKNAVLNYMPGWPVFSGLESDIRFTGQGMEIDVHAARLLGGRITAATVRLPDYLYPQLIAEGKGITGTDDVVRFLYTSPIAPEHRAFFESAAFAGRSPVTLKLQVPLADFVRRKDPLRYSGTVGFDNSKFALFGGAIDITEANGTLSFSEQGHHAEGISAKVVGNDASINVFTRAWGESDRSTHIVAHGRIEPALLGKRLDSAQLQACEGGAKWQGVLTLGHTRAGQAVPAELRITSDLVGVAMDLAPPLAKRAQEAKPIELSATLYGPERLGFGIDYHNELSARAEMATGDTISLLRAGVHFGAGRSALPKDAALQISGDTTNVALDEWLAQLKPAPAPSRRGETQAAFTLPIVLDLDALHVKPLDEEVTDELSTAKPVDFPLVRGAIRRLYYEGNELGQVDLVTSRAPSGIRIERFDITSELMKVRARGGWNYRGGRHTSTLYAHLESTDIGEMARRLGFASVIEKGEGEADLSAMWRAPFADFSFAKVSGLARVDLRKGSISEVDPGAGRLFGLLSLSALPRRLIGDFSDAFGAGLHFDRITGTFNIEDGNALTDDLRLKSPLATVDLEGRTGLGNQDFDQTVTVTPKLGETAAIGGALAFGAPVGAVVLLLDKLFGSPISKASARQYKVSGSWSDPVIERIKVAPADEPDDSDEEA